MASHEGEDGVWHDYSRFLNILCWNVICSIPIYSWSLLRLVYNINLNLWILSFPIRYPLEVLSIFVAIGIIIHSVLAFFGHYVPAPNARPTVKGKWFTHFRQNPIVWWAFCTCVINYQIWFLTSITPTISAFLLVDVPFNHLKIPDITFEPIGIIRGLIDENPHLYWFWFLIIFKFSKIIVHFRANHTASMQRACRPHASDLYKQSDVTVVIPTISCWGPDLENTIESILNNNVHQIIISTVGRHKQQNFQAKIARFLEMYEGKAEYTPSREEKKILVVTIPGANGDKRSQLKEGYARCETRILAYADDHVIWPDTYVTSVLSEFQDPRVGLVGTVKRVIREREPWTWNDWSAISDNLRNFLASIYLERHNYELNATYNLDGGVFVISGRTAFVRTQIFKENPGFEWPFESESWLGGGGTWWGADGPMKVDDDNYITRYMVDHGWKTVFHNRVPEGLMDNTLGTHGGWTRFRGQLMRWARTTIRSNTTSLFMEGTCWDAYPWTTFAMFVSCFFNIAIVAEGLIIYCLEMSGHGNWLTYGVLVLALLGTKFAKPWSHYKAYPEDLYLCVPQILFGYVHGLLRIYAILTASNVEWSGRKTQDVSHH